MEQLDNVVKEIQCKALVLIYLDLKAHKSSARERAQVYMETIEIINKEFNTHYKSFDLERIAVESENMRGFALRNPL